MTSGLPESAAPLVYLGCLIEVGKREITIFAPDGRRIFGPQRAAVSTAFRIIRGYRKGA